MDKNNIFHLQWEQEGEKLILRISLAWDSTKVLSMRHWAPYDQRNTEEAAIGKMWDRYSKDIISYIQGNPACKRHDSIMSYCVKCGIILLENLPHHMSMHICNPLQPIPIIRTSQEQTT